jgi:hypothetical protein
MECSFKGRFSLFEMFPPMSTTNFSNEPTHHFPKPQYSIIPVFQHSNYERSELSSQRVLVFFRLFISSGMQFAGKTY